MKKRKKKTIKRCIMSNKPLTNGKEFVVVDYALDYVKKQGYKVYKPKKEEITLNSFRIWALSFLILFFSIILMNNVLGNTEQLPFLDDDGLIIQGKVLRFTDFSFPTSALNINDGSPLAWSNPNNIIQIENQASASGSQSGTPTQQPQIQDNSVRISIGTGALIGDNKANSNINWLGIDNSVFYGGKNDLWSLSETITPSLVNDNLRMNLKANIPDYSETFIVSRLTQRLSATGFFGNKITGQTLLDFSDSLVFDNNIEGQTFKVLDKQFLDEVNLRLKRNGNISEATLSIYTSVNNTPQGNELETATLNVSSLSNSSVTEVIFNFSGNTELKPNVTYFLKLSSDGTDINNSLVLRYVPFDFYLNGLRLTSNDNGLNWNEELNHDWFFRVRGNNRIPINSNITGLELEINKRRLFNELSMNNFALVNYMKLKVYYIQDGEHKVTESFGIIDRKLPHLEFLPLASAQMQHLDGNFEVNKSINLILNCPSCTYANISKVITPSKNEIITNVEMSDNNGFFNYTITPNLVKEVGVYQVYGEGNPNGNIKPFQYTFKVNKQGILNFDFSDTTLLIFFIISLVIIGILVYFGYFAFGGGLMIFLGFLALHNQNLIFGLIMVFVGLVILSKEFDKNERSKFK